MAEKTTKISKKEQRRQEAAQQKRKRSILIAIPVIIVIVGLVGLILYRAFQPAVEGLMTFGTQDRTHDLEAEFTQAGLPPTGGSHNPAWQNCGIYDTLIENSLAVHALEHGVVWITYNPNLPGDQVEYLKEFVRGESKVLMSPYEGLIGDVVLSGWSKQLVIDTVPDDRISEFIGQYQGKGPEPNAPCDGGVGTPIE